MSCLRRLLAFQPELPGKASSSAGDFFFQILQVNFFYGHFAIAWEIDFEVGPVAEVDRYSVKRSIRVWRGISAATKIEYLCIFRHKVAQLSSKI